MSESTHPCGERLVPWSVVDCHECVMDLAFRTAERAQQFTEYARATEHAEAFFGKDSNGSAALYAEAARLTTAAAGLAASAPPSRLPKRTTAFEEAQATARLEARGERALNRLQQTDPAEYERVMADLTKRWLDAGAPGLP